MVDTRQTLAGPVGHYVLDNSISQQLTNDVVPLHIGIRISCMGDWKVRRVSGKPMSFVPAPTQRVVDQRRMLRIRVFQRIITTSRIWLADEGGIDACETDCMLLLR